MGRRRNKPTLRVRSSGSRRPPGRDAPRSSVRGFLTAARNRDYAQAAEYLDLRNLPTEITPAQGQGLARQLKIVLDRVLWIDLDLLSTSLEGDRADNLPVVRDRIGRLPREGGMPTTFCSSGSRAVTGSISGSFQAPRWPIFRNSIGSSAMVRSSKSCLPGCSMSHCWAFTSGCGWWLSSSASCCIRSPSSSHRRPSTS